MKKIAICLLLVFVLGLSSPAVAFSAESMVAASETISSKDWKMLLLATILEKAAEIAATHGPTIYQKGKEITVKMYEGTKQFTANAFDKTKEYAGNAYDKTKEWAGDAYDVTKDVAVFTYEKTKKLAGDAYDVTKDVAVYICDKTAEYAGKAYDKTADACKSVVNWLFSD